ncbi:MAG: hypothetical protein HY843_08305, partial [Bdellovibrio sp.]|nr:hypothetical protein [Bdellovibrio sp.]
FIILNNLVPDFVAKHHGSGVVRGSSNCFNTALVMSGFTSAFRYSDLGEIEFYLNSPLCRKVLSSEKPHPGDLIMIKPTDPDGLEYHAAVYVSEHLIFEKRNAAPIEPFQLNLLDQMLKEREVTPGCDRVDEINIKNCKIFSQYYRCKSIKEILEEGLLKNQKRYLELDSEVRAGEMQITNSTLCKDSPPVSELGAQISKSLTVLYSLVEQEMKDQFQESDNQALQTNPDAFLWAMLLSRIFLIQDELKLSGSDY